MPQRHVDRVDAMLAFDPTSDIDTALQQGSWMLIGSMQQAPSLSTMVPDDVNAYPRREGKAAQRRELAYLLTSAAAPYLNATSGQWVGKRSLVALVCADPITVVMAPISAELVS